MRRPFVKMHGLGNDYVFMDGREGLDLDAATVRALSDRRTGIGSDGVIVLERPRSSDNDARMVVFNADGSDGGVCGNGLRCLVAWLASDGLIDREAPRIEIGGGVVEAKVEGTVEPQCVLVSAEFPPPGLPCGLIPARIPGVADASPVVDRPIGLDSPEAIPGVRLDREASLTLVSTGNPHAVIWLGATPIDRARLDELVRAIGPDIERHEWFPERVNVHVCCGSPREGLRAATWERGSGPTKACGTGAAAVLVAGVLRDGPPGRGQPDEWVAVELPGGILENSWSGRPESPIRQRGPATEVFRGSFDGSRWRL